MPVVSSFYWIKIAIFYSDHNPPHFHVVYWEYKAIILIKTLEVYDWKLPNRALKMVNEWAEKNQDKLLEDWNLAIEHKVLNYIDPLI